MHFGDLFSEFPRRTVLKVSDASLQFVLAMNVKKHQAGGRLQHELAASSRQTRVDGQDNQLGPLLGSWQFQLAFRSH